MRAGRRARPAPARSAGARSAPSSVRGRVSTAVARRLLGEERDRDLADDLAVDRTRAARPSSVTSPMSAHSSSQLAADRGDRLEPVGRRSAIRSWLSEIMISTGSMSGLAERHAVEVDVDADAAAAAISASEEARPAAPRSCSDSTSPLSTSSRLASISFLPVNGSPTCTVGRLSSSSSESSWLASTLAPPIPSRPVVAPKRTTVARAAGARRA